MDWLVPIGTGPARRCLRFQRRFKPAANSGKASDQMLTPKLALIFGPWQKTELYLNYGHGFHSNDARGTTIRVDPADGVTPVQRQAPGPHPGLRDGVRSEPLAGWQSTLSLWQLAAASELLFVGDAGTTEASRPSRRYGVEWTNLYVLADWLAIDADLAWSHARFRDHDPLVGDYIPGAVSTTANIGITSIIWPMVRFPASALFRSPPADRGQRSTFRFSALTNLRVGYRLAPRTQLASMCITCSTAR
jgi:hypothetical protein